MCKRLDLVGDKFGRLVVVELDHKTRSSVYWGCKCGCGVEKIITGSNLKSGGTVSCGCYRTENNTKHGMRHTRFYITWKGIKARCSGNPVGQKKNYIGRGISVCKRWNKFENFRDDMYKLYINHCDEFGEKNTFIDRVDNDGNYCKKNCKWSTRLENNCNKRSTIYITFNGITRKSVDWAKDINIKSKTLTERIKKLKWPLELALKTPLLNNNNRYGFRKTDITFTPNKGGKRKSK